MNMNMYYSTSDISEISDSSTATIKIIAKKFSQSIVSFGAKKDSAWRFNLREMSSIKYVIDNGRRSGQDKAIEMALWLFYGIDCKRDV